MPAIADLDNARDLEDKPRARKPYIISKPRETWSTAEHERFVEALRLYVRDWKNIEAYIGTKTAIQIRSHAQKYFQKQVKEGNSASVPPPRPKRQPGCGSRDARKRRSITMDPPSGRSCTGETTEPLSPHAAAAAAREALQAPPLAVFRTQRQPTLLAPVKRAVHAAVQCVGAVSDSAERENVETGSGSNSADAPNCVQGALPLQLLPESSAGSADAAAVLADWGRPSSAIDSSTAHALRTAHARDCTASESPAGSAAMQQTATQWREHGTVPSYGALPPHHAVFINSAGGARAGVPAPHAGAELGSEVVPTTPFPTWSQLCGVTQAPHNAAYKAAHNISGNSVVNRAAGGSGGSDDPSGGVGPHSGSGATAGISPQLSAVAKVEEQLGRTGMFGSGAQYSTVQPGVDTGLTLPPGLQLDPGADFTLIYAFLGSLFDGSRTDVDHWRVLAEMDPTTRRMAEHCMRNLFANMQLAQWQNAGMMPMLPAQQ